MLEVTYQISTSINYGEPLFYHPQTLSRSGNLLWSKGISFCTVGALVSSKKFKLRLNGTLERFCMEPFRVGTDRLPVYTMSWNLSVQNRSFPCFHTRTVPNDSLSLHSSGTRKILENVFPPHTFSSKPSPKFSSRASFSLIISYHQSNFLLPHF